MGSTRRKTRSRPETSMPRRSRPHTKGCCERHSRTRDVRELPVASIRGHWDSYYRNIVDAIQGRQELAVTAEQAREVVRVLDAAVESWAAASCH